MRRSQKRQQHHSTLRTIREATGLSQAAFAEAIGSTKAIVENVEMNRSELDKSLLERIVAFTGAVPKSISTGAPVDFHGRPFTSESFQQWKRFDYTDKQAKELIQLSADYLSILLVAATETPGGTKTPHLFRTLLLDLNEWIFDRVRRHNLGWIIENRMTTQLAERREETSTAGACRRLFAKNVHWQQNDDPKWHDREQVCYTVTSFPLFIPYVGFLSWNGLPAFANGARRRRNRYDIRVADKSFSVVVDELQGKLTLAADGKPLLPETGPVPISTAITPQSKQSSSKRRGRVRASKNAPHPSA